MHAAGGAIVAGLGGGNALGGALGAGLTSKLGKELNDLSKDPRKDERKRIQQDIAPQFAAAHPGMTVEQATQILADQLLRQVDTTAAAKGGWNQDAANYLNNYAAAHASETVGKDQWGNAVPLFGTAAGYQRNDSTIFSANPQTEIPPPALGFGSLGGYFKGVGQGLAETLGHPLDTIWGSLKGVYTTIADPVGTAKHLQDEVRNAVIQVGHGDFGPAGNNIGQQLDTTLIDSVTATGGGVLIGKVIPGVKDSKATAGTADATANNNFYRDGLPYDVRRIAYEADSRSLSNTVDKMRVSGSSEEAVARWAVDERNALKLQYRDISPPEFVAAVEARNVEKYGNKLGPTVEQLRQKGLSWTEIANAAARPGGQDLGFGK
ncbi:Uncharacterised protein [Pandoraea pulmonicola]|nr:Uncharacterised protein [Pandoraea pulmonicola]